MRIFPIPPRPRGRRRCGPRHLDHPIGAVIQSPRPRPSQGFAMLTCPIPRMTDGLCRIASVCRYSGDLPGLSCSHPGASRGGCQVSGGLVECSHAWRIGAGIRPRSGTSRPLRRAQSRISAGDGPVWGWGTARSVGRPAIRWAAAASVVAQAWAAAR